MLEQACRRVWVFGLFLQVVAVVESVGIYPYPNNQYDTYAGNYGNGFINNQVPSFVHEVATQLTENQVYQGNNINPNHQLGYAQPNVINNNIAYPQNFGYGNIGQPLSTDVYGMSGYNNQPIVDQFGVTNHNVIGYQQPQFQEHPSVVSTQNFVSNQFPQGAYPNQPVQTFESQLYGTQEQVVNSVPIQHAVQNHVLNQQLLPNHQQLLSNNQKPMALVQPQQFDTQTVSFLSQIQNLYQPAAGKATSATPTTESVYFVMPNNMIAKYPNDVVVVAKGEPKPGFSIVKWSPYIQALMKQNNNQNQITRQTNEQRVNTNAKMGQYDYYGNYNYNYNDKGLKNDYNYNSNYDYNYAYDGSDYAQLDNSQTGGNHNYDYQAPAVPVNRPAKRYQGRSRRMRKVPPARKQFRSHRQLYQRQRYRVPMYMKFAKSFGNQRRQTQRRVRPRARVVQHQAQNQGNDYEYYDGEQSSDYADYGPANKAGGKDPNVKYIYEIEYV